MRPRRRGRDHRRDQRTSAGQHGRHESPVKEKTEDHHRAEQHADQPRNDRQRHQAAVVVFFRAGCCRRPVCCGHECNPVEERKTSAPCPAAQPPASLSAGCNSRYSAEHLRTRKPAMSEHILNKGPQDVGGETGEAIDTIDHGMAFWEKQANGLRSVLSGRRIIRVDELRRAAEDLGDLYSKLAYFERTTMALRTVLLEKGFMTEAELKNKMEQIRSRFNVPDEMESPVKKAAVK
ncbi:MAG: nitrile hydratase subunit beta [Betaproteobacteria bacterium]|nr:nitrile hydratase subunit beta [Betaproteobacteria bacterium]